MIFFEETRTIGQDGNGKNVVWVSIHVDTAADLPAYNDYQSDGFILCMGSIAHTIADNKLYELNSSGVWVDITPNSGAYTLPPATANSLGGIMVGTGLSIDSGGVLSATGSYTLPPATVSSLGGIMVGTGLTIDSAGVLSASGGASMPYTNHNGGIRGNNLGSSYTASQQSAIASGDFTDIYVGDYWTFGGNVWRVVDIDTFLGTGSPKTQEHHVIIMPDEPPASSAWGTSDFRYSTINTSVIPQIISDLVSDIGGDYLINQSYKNIGSSDWIQSKMMIPCLSNLFGICENREGVTANQSKALMQEQFALFRFERKWIASQPSGNVWTTDYSSNLNANLVVDGSCFYGYNGLSSSNGVRPYALLAGTLQ